MTSSQTLTQDIAATTPSTPPHPARVHRPARDGDQGARSVRGLHRHRPRRHRRARPTPGSSSTIKTASVATGNADRDGHLRSGDFFDAEANPEITFVSTDVSRDGAEWTITGDLTIKGVTNSVTIPFEETGTAQDPFGNVRVGFEGAVTVNRKDWGLTWNAALETGGVLVSEKIKLEFDVSAIKNA